MGQSIQSTVLQVAYKSGAKVEFGNELNPRAVSKEPAVHWEANDNDYYTLSMSGKKKMVSPVWLICSISWASGNSTVHLHHQFLWGGSKRPFEIATAICRGYNSSYQTAFSSVAASSSESVFELVAWAFFRKRSKKAK